MKIKRSRNRSTTPAQSTAIESLSAFEAYAKRRELEAKISAMQRESKALREIIESEFRANQVRLVSDDGLLTLIRETRTVAPFTNPGYSYHVFTLAQTK